MIGVLHRIAASMFEEFQLVGGVFGTSLEMSLEHGQQLGLDSSRIYPDLSAFIEGERVRPEKERIEAVSILTPNYLHFPMAKALLENGFHLICEKPLTTTYSEAKTLRDLAELSNRVIGVTYTYTGYPMVRQMREMIRSGQLGKIQKVDAQYYQGWINPVVHDKEKRKSVWRLDPAISGPSCCIGDIGTHAFDMLEYLTGLRVQRLLADLDYMYEDNAMDVDGTVLLRMETGAKGLISASQVATGEENSFVVKIYGSRGGLNWNQENPNELYFLEENKPGKVFRPGNPYNHSFSLEGTKLPPGHPEGIFDAMGNIYRGVAKAIRGEQFDPASFPGLGHGIRGVNFVECVLKSHREGNVWVDLDDEV